MSELGVPAPKASPACLDLSLSEVEGLQVLSRFDPALLLALTGSGLSGPIPNAKCGFGISLRSPC